LVRILVVGAGRISLSHIPHILTHSKSDLVGIVEPGRISRFIIKILANVPVYSSLNKVPKNSFDGAFILTPPSTHFNLAYSLLDAGKHVFIEKPLTLSPNHSKQLVELAMSKNVQISVGYVYRYHPVFMHLKTELEKDIFESINSVEISMSGNVVSSETPKTWRNTGLGSGCIFDYGCHVIDLSLFLFGRPDKVICLDKHEIFQKGVIDKFSATLSYEKDFNVNIVCNWADSSLRKAGIEIKIYTDKNIIWSDGQRIEISGDNPTKHTIKDLNTDVSYYLRGEEFQIQLDNFFSNIINKSKNYTGAEDAASCDEIIAKLYEYKL